MTKRVIRRDTPLVAGQTLQLRVVTYYQVSVDEYLDGEASITIDEIQVALGGKYRSVSQMAEAARRGDVGPHEDGDVDFVIEVPLEWAAEVRFESEYEEKRRLAGTLPNYGYEYVTLEGTVETP